MTRCSHVSLIPNLFPKDAITSSSSSTRPQRDQPDKIADSYPRLPLQGNYTKVAGLVDKRSSSDKASMLEYKRLTRGAGRMEAEQDKPQVLLWRRVSAIL